MKIPGLIKKLFDIPFIRFLFVAGINTCFGYMTFAVCQYILKNLVAAVIVANIINILFNFKTYGRIVFKSKDHSRVFRFFGVYLCTMAIQLVVLKKVFPHFGLNNPYISVAILTLPLAVLSFVLMRTFVFKTAAKE